MPNPRLNLILRSSARIIGTPFPGEALTASRAGQWSVDGVAVAGSTGASYTVGVADIGKSIQCGAGQTVTVWHPRDVGMVKGCWVPFSGVLNSIGPDVPATNDQFVRDWVDIVNGYRVGQTTGLNQPKFNTGVFGSLPAVSFVPNNSLIALTGGILGAIRNCGFAYLITSHKWDGVGGTGVNFYVASFNREQANPGTVLAIINRLSTNSSNSTASCRRTFAQTVATTTLGAPDTNVHVDTAQAEFSNNILRGRRDGSEISTVAIGTSGLSQNQDCYSFEIGNFARENNNSYNGSIGAVMVVAGNSALSSTDRNRLEQFAGLCAGTNLGLTVS